MKRQATGWMMAMTILVASPAASAASGGGGGPLGGLTGCLLGSASQRARGGAPQWPADGVGDTCAPLSPADLLSLRR